jgi:hypothetical protein
VGNRYSARNVRVVPVRALLVHTGTQDKQQHIHKPLVKIQTRRSDTGINFSKSRDCHIYHLVSTEKL